MEGVERVYHSGVRYAKNRYLPNTVGSVVFIVLYTVIVFYMTEFLLRGRLTRWLYLGSLVMVIAMIYAGELEIDENGMPMGQRVRGSEG